MTRPIATNTITQMNAAHVLGALGIEGSPPKEDALPDLLIRAAMIADDYNLERLERGYEGLVSAVRVYRELPDGISLLKRLAFTTPF